MIYVLLAIFAALVAWMFVSLYWQREVDTDPHPLDGATKPKPAQPLDPDHTWPFPPNKP